MLKRTTNSTEPVTATPVEGLGDRFSRVTSVDELAGRAVVQIDMSVEWPGPWIARDGLPLYLYPDTPAVRLLLQQSEREGITIEQVVAAVLQANDVPLDAWTRRYAAMLLRKHDPALTKHQHKQRERHGLASCFTEIKEAFMGAGETATEAEARTSEHLGKGVDAMRKYLQRVRRKAGTK
jgi:hypothetical protein